MSNGNFPLSAFGSQNPSVRFQPPADILKHADLAGQIFVPAILNCGRCDPFKKCRSSDCWPLPDDLNALSRKPSARLGVRVNLNAVQFKSFAFGVVDADNRIIYNQAPWIIS
jgi:hypothetical protein